MKDGSNIIENSDPDQEAEQIKHANQKKRTGWASRDRNRSQRVVETGQQHLAQIESIKWNRSVRYIMAWAFSKTGLAKLKPIYTNS
jgi:hypothetical protein